MPIRYSALTSAAYAAFHSCSARRHSRRRSAFLAALTWVPASANAGAAMHTTIATGTAANARMHAPTAARRRFAQHSARLRVLSSSMLFGPRGACKPAGREIDQRDARLPRDFEDALVAVELSIDDALDPGVRDHLE